MTGLTIHGATTSATQADSPATRSGPVPRRLPRLPPLSRLPRLPRPPFAWWFPVTVFALTRAYGVVAIAVAARHQIPLPQPASWLSAYFVHTPTPASPGYWSVITNWDGQWYEQIATHGYQLPVAGDPQAADVLWAWAFPPVFPLTVRLIMTGLGLSFAVSATLLNLVAGAGAVIVLFRLVQDSVGRWAAAATVALTCCFVTAPLFQAAYSESLAMLLLVSALLLLTRRRYAATLACVVLLSFTRLITPPLAIVVLAHGLHRWRTGDRAQLRRDLPWLAMLTLASLGGALAWSIVTRLILGGRSTGADRGSAGWLAEHGFGWFSGLYRICGWPGIAVLSLALLALALLAHSSLTTSWSSELKVWLWAYPLYLMAAVPIHTGIFRYLLLAFPLPLAMMGRPGNERPSRAWLTRVALACAVGMGLQWVWVSVSLVVSQGAVWMP